VESGVTEANGRGWRINRKNWLCGPADVASCRNGRRGRWDGAHILGGEVAMSADPGRRAAQGRTSNYTDIAKLLEGIK